VPKIRINASEIGFRKNVSSAQEEFLRHCRLRNLSPRTIEYYRENLNYVRRVLNLEYADELTRERIDDLVAHEMDKGNKVVAINSRIRGLRVFVHFCADREYLDDFKYQLLKTDQEQKEPYRALVVPKRSIIVSSRGGIKRNFILALRPRYIEKTRWEYVRKSNL